MLHVTTSSSLTQVAYWLVFIGWFGYKGWSHGFLWNRLVFIVLPWEHWLQVLNFVPLPQSILSKDSVVSPLLVEGVSFGRWIIRIPTVVVVFIFQGCCASTSEICYKGLLVLVHGGTSSGITRDNAKALILIGTKCLLFSSLKLMKIFRLLLVRSKYTGFIGRWLQLIVPRLRNIILLRIKSSHALCWSCFDEKIVQWGFILLVTVLCIL